MLYVFHVDTGTMMTFDINMALESVVSLKLMIERVCRIPASSQVLLVSGGEVLRPDARVCSYSAGTDTNPIYMFSKTIIESSEPPRSTIDYGSDVDLRDQVETCISMAGATANYSTVVACSQLAQQFWELAREHTHVCEKLVHDQHLQQQGWAAVVANMEDVTTDFQERAQDFEQKFKEHLKKKDEYSEFLSKFNEDLETLSNIPILPALRLNAAANPFTAFDDLHADSESYSENQHSDDDSENKLPSLEEGHKEPIGVTIVQTDAQVTTGSNDGSSKAWSLQGAGGSTASEGDEGIETSREGQDSGVGGGGSGSGGKLVRTGRGRQSTREAITLLHWITAKENQESLKDIAKYCKNALELFDGSVMTTLRTEVAEALASAGQEGMKRIKGLEERLSGLEQLMCEAKRIEQEQKDLANSFLAKATNLGDVSVLRMLSESHCQQLQSMQRNQQKLRDVKGRCARAKEELAVNLYHRLKWIVYVENRMFETDSRLMFYHRSLSRLKRHLAVIGQLHKAPRLFCTAVHEIVRRRTFSQAFLAWASDLASHLLTIHNEEVSKRRTFNSLFSGHFLSGLFPGTEDIPPTFATQPPQGFDIRLPKISQTDIQTLAARLPNLTPEIPVSDMTNVTQFFAQRSGPPDKILEPQIVDEKLLAVVREAGLDRGFESETDTDEYEKVGQSPMLDGTAVGGTTAGLPLPPPPLSACDATTLTEENQESQRREAAYFREILSSLSHICSESITVLRNELNKLKMENVDQQVVLKNHCNEILTAWDKCNSENEIRRRETLQRLTVDHELELNDIKQAIVTKEEELHVHNLENAKLESKYSQIVLEMTVKISNLESRVKSQDELVTEQAKKLDELELSKQKSLKELQEKMAQEYKAEIESLRSRFRLVALTSMDRSPSESSLEKIERADMIEITNHKAILAQTKEDMEIEREEAIKSALENQESELKKKLEEELNKLRSKYEAERQVSVNDAVRRIIDEKDRQLEQSRERESILLRECMKYKETIQQLSDPETSDFQSMSFLQSRLDTLEAEKLCLENKLNEKREITKHGKEQQTDQVELRDSFTNPDSKSRQRWFRSNAFSVPLAMYNSTSCSIGDTVMIVYDHDYNNFSILQAANADHETHQAFPRPLDIAVYQDNAEDTEGDGIQIVTTPNHDPESISESPSVFLLHIDCLSTLDLVIPAKEEERLYYYIGKVESKDYCIAVKSRNRYNVPLGSRFYRVKVRPLKSSEIPSKGQAFCCDISLVKERDSSQRRVMSGMTSSAIVGSTTGSSFAKGRDAGMGRSVCAIQPESISSSVVTRNEEGIGSEVVLSSEECVNQQQQQQQTEQLDSIELNNPEDLQQNRSNLREGNESPLCEPEESVPYEISKGEHVTTDAMMSSEQYVSEVAEEAAP